MSTLHQRLADLADLGTADAATDVREPAAAWQRGLRYRRRRRVGTAAIVVVTLALLASIGGVALVRRDSVIAPAGSNAAAGLPDRLYQPSPWLAGTADEGPLGQLSVLIPAERKVWVGGSSEEVVGVSATSGEYRFLDLPDRAEGGELSPDGRHVAYWLTGRPSRSPNTAGGQSLVVTGVAVYDVVTGDVRSAPLETEHGIAVDGLLWADDDTVLVGYGQEMGGDGDPDLSSSSNRHRWFVWPTTARSPQAVALLRAGDDLDTAAEGRALADQRIVDLDGGVANQIRFNASAGNVTALDPTGTRVALPGTGGRNNRVPSTLQVTAVDGTTSIVPDSEGTYAALAWVDATHVAIQTLPPPDYIDDLRVEVVDVVDGTRREVLDSNGVGNVFQLTTDLLSEPTLEAVEPPRPPDPRWVAAVLASFALLSGVGLLRWRRRAAS